MRRRALGSVIHTNGHPKRVRLLPDGGLLVFASPIVIRLDAAWNVVWKKTFAATSGSTVRFYDMADARWDMAPPMQLVYTQHAFNPRKFGQRETRLSYVNPIAFDELQQRLRAEGKQADKARAAQLQRTF